MEHIKSEALIDKLDNYLGNPRFDPHGDPIPTKEGKFMIRNQYSLDLLHEGETGVLVGVRHHMTEFLNYLNELKIALGTELRVIKKLEFDKSTRVRINNNEEVIFPKKIARDLYVKKK